MSVVNSTHIWIDDRGVAWIDQTNLKVTEIALERLAHGSSVEEIVDQHKGLITLAQVHAAHRAPEAGETGWRNWMAKLDGETGWRNWMANNWSTGRRP